MYFLFIKELSVEKKNLQNFVNGKEADSEDYSQPIKYLTELHDAGNNGKIIFILVQFYLTLSYFSCCRNSFKNGTNRTVQFNKRSNYVIIVLLILFVSQVFLMRYHKTTRWMILRSF